MIAAIGRTAGPEDPADESGRWRSHLRSGSPVNGAEALLRTLVDSGVDVCFGNPGTSEMHFVAAPDTVPELRAVLGIDEVVDPLRSCWPTSGWSSRTGDRRDAR